MEVMQRRFRRLRKFSTTNTVWRVFTKLPGKTQLPHSSSFLSLRLPRFSVLPSALPFSFPNSPSTPSLFLQLIRSRYIVDCVTVFSVERGGNMNNWEAIIFCYYTLNRATGLADTDNTTTTTICHHLCPLLMNKRTSAFFLLAKLLLLAAHLLLSILVTLLHHSDKMNVTEYSLCVCVCVTVMLQVSHQ